MKLNPETSLRVGVSLGFALVLALMIATITLGLLRMSQIHGHMETIIKISNVKTELAHAMKDAFRERAVIMHTVSLLGDPFEQNEEFLNFNDLGVAFTHARTQMEELPLSPEEKEILTAMRSLTAKTQPLVVKAVDYAMSGNNVQARALIQQEIITSQKLIALDIGKLLDLQKQETHRATTEAAKDYENTQLIMLILGVTAGGLGVGIAYVVSRNANKQAQLLQHQAMFDNLTNLPNRALFADRLQQAILIGRREKQPFAVIAMDIDRFKEINDTLGHHAGDLALRHVATCTRSCLRESDTVARMGGDEFVVLLATAGDMNGTVTVAKKILAVLNQPFQVQGHNLEISASLGIVIFPEHGEDPAVLLREADAAMYFAKQTHAGYKIYSADLGHGVDDRLALQSELRHAIANQELVLHYQPKIDFNANRVSGVEALVRWQHPRHGLLAPDKFIPLAEQTGLIKPLTQEVLKRALSQCEQWHKAGMNLSVSVNISAISIQDPEFPAQVSRLLEDVQIPASLLELEVTETAVMSEPQRAVECIQKLSALGLQVSIDDFGTGYSSMAYLKKLLVAKIKIDKSFVKDMIINHNDAVIVRSTVELGHNLGLKVVAEGVETQKVWDQLKELGCDTAQGYYMSRPLAADKFLEWLSESPWAQSNDAADKAS